MGEVVRSRRKRLAGFLPDDIGAAETDRRRQDQYERDRMIDLIGFARSGQPTILNRPDDCA